MQAGQTAAGATPGEPTARVKCPACGTLADFQANICVECGLDFRTGKKLRKPPSTAMKLQRVNQRIKSVRADLRKEMNLLVVQGVSVMGLFLAISSALFTMLPFLWSWTGLCLLGGAFSLVLALLAWVRGNEAFVRVRQVRQEMLIPLIERRYDLLRECSPHRYWLHRLWLPATALLCVMITAAVVGLAWLRNTRTANLDASLQSAILADDPGRVRELLSAGAAPNSKHGSSRFTPLHVAAQHGHARIVRILIDAGADVDAVDSRGLHPLDICVNSWMASSTNDTGFAESVARLVEHGAKLTPLRTREDPSRTGKSELDERLAQSAERGRGRFVEFLLSAGADPNVTDLSGATPLARCIAARHDRDTTLSVILPLLKAGADPNLTAARWSPLHDAVEQGNVDLVRCLLEHGADPELRHRRRTPSDIATAQGQTEITALLNDFSK